LIFPLPRNRQRCELVFNSRSHLFLFCTIIFWRVAFSLSVGRLNHHDSPNGPKA
jgi:hypothetical protein